MELDSESWATLYLGSSSLEEIVAAGKAKLVKGDQEEVAGVFDLFDKLVLTRRKKSIEKSIGSDSFDF